MSSQDVKVGRQAFEIWFEVGTDIIKHSNKDYFIYLSELDEGKEKLVNWSLFRSKIKVKYHLICEKREIAAIKYCYQPAVIVEDKKKTIESYPESAILEGIKNKSDLKSNNRRNSRSYDNALNADKNAEDPKQEDKCINNSQTSSMNFSKLLTIFSNSNKPSTLSKSPILNRSDTKFVATSKENNITKKMMPEIHRSTMLFGKPNQESNILPIKTEEKVQIEASSIPLSLSNPLAAQKKEGNHNSSILTNLFLEKCQLLNTNKKEMKDNCESFCVAFFISGLQKENANYIPDSENWKASCGHQFCSQLPAISPDILFKYPPIDDPSLEISSFTASIFYPRGLKICYCDSPENLSKPYSPDSSLTNQEGTRYYLQSYQMYLKIEKPKFDKNYKINLANAFIQFEKYISIFNNSNMQQYFEQKLEKRLEIITEINFKDFVYIPISFVLVSKQPYQNEMKSILCNIAHSMVTNEFDITYFNQLMFHITKELPAKPNLPIKATSKDTSGFKVKGTILNFFLPKVRYPYLIQYPSPREIYSYCNNSLSILLLEFFSEDQIMLVFYLMKTEQKLLFHSENPEEISKIINAFLNLLYPLEWTNTLIPLLSYEMVKYTQSFMPYIMGIENHLLSSIEEYLDENNLVYIISIDDGTICIPNFSDGLGESSKKQQRLINRVSLQSNFSDFHHPLKIYEKALEKLKELKIEFSYFNNTQINLLKTSEIAFSKLKSFNSTVTSNSKDKSYYFNLLCSLSDNTIINQISSSTSELKKNLELKSKLMAYERTVRFIFLSANESEFGDFEKYLSFIDELPLFNADSFIKSKKDEDRMYFEDLVNTQVFNTFLQINYKAEQIFKEKIAIQGCHRKADSELCESSINLRDSMSATKQYVKSNDLNSLIEKVIEFVNQYPESLYSHYFVNPYFLKDNFNQKVFINHYSYSVIDCLKLTLSEEKEQTLMNESLKSFQVSYIVDQLNIPSLDEVVKFLKSFEKYDKIYFPFSSFEGEAVFKRTLCKLNSYNIVKKRVSMLRCENSNRRLGKPETRNIKELINDAVTKILTSIPLTSSDKAEMNELLLIDEGKYNFPRAIYQKKFKDGLFHCLDNISFRDLKALVTMFYINCGVNKDHFEAVKMVTRSLFCYYRSNSKNQAIFLAKEVSAKNSTFAVFSSNIFWTYFLENEIKELKTKKEEVIVSLILKQSSLLFELNLDIQLILGITMDNWVKAYLTNPSLIKSVETTIVKMVEISKLKL